MIPKIIHYVWVGNNPKPKDIKKCMKTWKKHLKDYKIIEWNESNFDISSHPFVKKAYEAKKWAYVSDYIRILENFDKFLNNKVFVGFERENYPFTAVFGAEKKNKFIKKLLDYYDNLDAYNFDFENNNTISVSNILINEYGCSKENKEQLLKDGIKVYKDDILCNPSKNSTTVHIFTGTWLEGIKPLKRKIVTALKTNIKTKKQAEIYRKIFMR